MDKISEARRNSPAKTPGLKRTMGGSKLDKPTFGEKFMLNMKRKAGEAASAQKYSAQQDASAHLKKGKGSKGLYGVSGLARRSYQQDGAKKGVRRVPAGKNK